MVGAIVVNSVNRGMCNIHSFCLILELINREITDMIVKLVCSMEEDNKENCQ